jgi:hypothetical protein
MWIWYVVEVSSNGCFKINNWFIIIKKEHSNQPSIVACAAILQMGNQTLRMVSFKKSSFLTYYKMMARPKKKVAPTVFLKCFIFKVSKNN